MLGVWSLGVRLCALLLCCERRSGSTGPPTSDVLADLDPAHTYTHLFILEYRQENWYLWSIRKLEQGGVLLVV
jgi:hypothetical protein